LPHIGAQYGELSARILIIAESHYLPKELNHKIKAEDWYHYPEQVYQLIEEEEKK